MSIAVDQSRLRQIVEHFVPRGALDDIEATTLLEIAQLAAGADRHEDPAERAMLHAIAQHLGLKPGDLRPIPPLPDDEAQQASLDVLARQLTTPGTHELAYSLAFLLTVADLELVAQETTTLEAFQHALGLDHRRATDLVVFLAEIVAA